MLLDASEIGIALYLGFNVFYDFLILKKMWQILNLIDPPKKLKKLPHFIVLKEKKRKGLSPYFSH